MTRLALAAALASLPGIALAGPYDGVYRQSAGADCAAIGEDGGALRIAEGVFTGVDGDCRMTRPVNVIDMDATLYTMECSGEDTVWTERVMVMNTADGDGILMVWDGYAFRYDRCEAPAAE